LVDAGTVVVMAAVGAELSITIEVDKVDAVAGPVLFTASVTLPALRRGISVPSEQLVTVMVRLVLAAIVAAAGVNTQPVAVPAFSKSAAAIPEVASLNLVVKATFVAEVCAPATVVAISVTAGPAISRVIEVATRLLAGPGIPTRSFTLPAARVNTTVPEEQPVTVTATAVAAVAVALAGLNTQPVAVPVFVKSAAARPVTPSLKVRL
jgi:hypothetical protein